MKTIALALATLVVAASNALAAPIYRCGPDGRIYSQMPCAEGTIIEATDPRTAAQRAEAKRVVAAERQKAVELERERAASAPAATPTAPAPDKRTAAK